MKVFKNKNNCLKEFFIFLVAAIFSIMSFAACEVGLGSAVDTQAPTVSITYPPSLSIIKDSFVFAGTWTDDMGVKTVHVDVYQSKDEGKKLVYSDEATVATDGNWSIELNQYNKANSQYYNGWQFSDGDYEIQAYAEDNAKHTSGIASRSFSIDNTAPVLVITNPTTAGNDATPAAFGQIVQLKGSFYDFCGKIDNLTVTFYDEQGNALCDSSFSNISDMSDANPLTIARYYTNQEDRANNAQIYNNYVALFGRDKVTQFEADNPIESSKVYFTVTASDSAKEFKSIDDNGTGNGNASTVFYRGTASMQNLVSGDGAIEGFSLVDFASYLNKTSTKHSSYASIIDSIASAAQSFSTTITTTPSIANYITNNDSTAGTPVYLTYTLNPKNNPQFIIGGYEIKTQTSPAIEGYSSKGYKNVYQNSPVPLNITVGADNKNISTHTVSFYLIDTDDSEYQNYTDQITPATFETQHDWVELLHTWNEEVYDRFSAWGGDWSARYTPSSQDTNVSSLTKQLTIENFTPTHNYLFYVVGKDITGNEIIAADSRGYGFCGTISASAPTVLINDGNRLNDTVTLNQFNGEGSKILFISGTINSDQPVNSFTYKVKVDNTEKPVTLTPLTAVPSNEYLADYSNNYCYPTSSNSYAWRVATKPVSSDFASAIGTGSYNITIEVKANNGATNEGTTQRTFTLDTSAPEATLSEVSNSADKADNEYWVNPTKDFTLRGLVTDNLSPATACETWIQIKTLDDGTELYSTKNTPAQYKKTWEFTIPANTIPSSYDGANLYLYAKDAAGNEGCSATPIKLYFDSVAPKGIHLIDFYNKDIVFRVSDFDSSAADVDDTDGTVSYSTALDTDVGGKYLKGSYTNTSTLKIRGYFEEKGSGVDMIYYKVFDHDPSTTEIANFAIDYDTSGSENKATGYFKPLTVPETKQVMYQTNTTHWHAAKVKSTFKETIAGLDHSNNYLILLAVDKVGNVQVDTLNAATLIDADNIVDDTDFDENAVCIWQNVTGGSVDVSAYTTEYNTAGGFEKWNGGFNSLSLNVDTESPKLSDVNRSGQQYTNKVTEIKVEGKYADEPSGHCAGVKSISLKVNSKEVYATLKSDNKWEAVIPVSILKDLAATGNYNVDATVKDKAGNASSVTIFSLQVDTAAPVAKISTPSTSTKLNGKITLTGTVDSAEGTQMYAEPATLTLYATPDKPLDTDTDDLTASASWTKIGETITDSASIYSWSFADIDTYSISKVTESPTTKKLYFIPVITDTAGNSNICTKTVGAYNETTQSYAINETYSYTGKYFEYTVDMDSDRPTVKVTNLTLSGDTYILKYGENSKIEGTVSDDDATSTNVVKQFIASSSLIDSSYITQNSTTKEWTIADSGATGTTTYNHSTGEWTFTPAVTEDGEKEVYFYIVDNAGELFYTGKEEAVGTTKTYHQPYFQYKTSVAEDHPAALEYKSDKTSPTISSVKILVSDTWSNVKNEQSAKDRYFTDEVCETKATDTTADNTTVYKQLDTGTNTVVGGKKYEKIKFVITASDSNGIKNMSLEYTPASGIGSSTDSSRGTFEETDDDTQAAVWITEEIDVSGFATGSVTVSVSATDQCGLLGNQSPVFMVDNTGPSINISSPGNNDEVSGKVSIAGQATDSGGAGEPTIHFLIPTSTQKNAQVASGKTDLEYYKTLSVSAGNWIGNLKAEKTPAAFEFVFDGDVNNNASLDIYTKSDNSNIYGLTADSEGIFSIPMYFRSQDALGNINVIKFTVKYNPDADKPKTEISYPSAANYQGSNNFVTLGGTIRVTGSVTIPSLTTTPNKVYIQIASQNGDWGEVDKAKAGTGDGNYGYAVKTVADVHSDIGKDVTGFTSTTLKNAWWGIEAVRSSNAWSFNLNETGSLNPESGVNEIKIRACAINEEGKMGAWSEPVSIHIDASAPEYTTKLYQFSDTPEVGAQTSEKEYEPGMYLKGQWYIGIHLTDNQGISDSGTKQIKIQRNSGTVAANEITKIWKDDNENSDDYHKELDLYIKLSNTIASQTYKVEVCDTADPEHWVYPTYEIQVDNTPPTLDVIKTGEGYPLSMTKQRTSNNVMTFGSSATDSGSGFSRLAYYFKRGSSIEVPVPTLVNATQKEWEVGTGYAGTLSEKQEELYGISLNGSKTVLNNGNTTFTSANIPSYSFIRKGGLVKMAGTYHLITDVSGTVVTVSGKIESAVTTAFFPAAFIVDNTSAEASTWAGGVNTITGDDGDGVVESVKKSGTTWTWDTSVYAGELDDGEVILVCVAFDVAENFTKNETTFMLTNKTPRLSKLYLSTDLNGDGKYSEDELGTSVITSSGAKTVEKYYSALNAGSLQDVFTIYGNTDDETNSTTDSRITMRDNLGIAFEFISGHEGYGSGQGTMNYKLSVSQSPIETAETGITGELTTPDEDENKYVNSGVTASLIGKKFLELEPADFTGQTPTFAGYKELLVNGETGYDASANYLNYIHITLWDSSNNKAGTKDSVPIENNYTNSNGNAAKYNTYTSFGAQWTAFNIPLYMDLVDGLRPIVTINDPVPLSATEGHVDLSSTLSSTNFSSSNELDGDDKVSGKIKFTGTINDERRISEIKLTVNKSFSNTTVSGTTLATYSTTTGAFDNTTIVPNGATGLTFRILSSTFSTASGHTVTWELEVDSEKVGNNAVADKDVLFTLTANDGTGDGTGTHQIDIVPYITKLYTGLSDSAGEEFARSAIGKYVVRAGETVRMYGYNLKAGTNAVKVSYTSGDPTSLTPTASNATETSTYGAHLKLPIGTDAKSGKVTITVNGVQSLNNLNTNPTFVSATDDTVTAYENNSQANGITNNRLNDDVELWVWDLGAFLTETDITSPMMKMDKNSNYYMSYGYGVPSMYVNKNGTTRQVDFSYNKFHNTNVIFDDNGNIFAVATNTDRVVNDSSRFVLYTPHNDYMPDYVDSSDKYEYQYRRTSKRHLEMAYNTATGVYNINRVKRPKLASYTDGANTYLGVVYFDYNNNDSPVRFRFGKKENGTPSFTQQGNTQYTFTYNAGQTRFETTSNTSLDGRYVMINSNYYKLTRVGTNNNRYRLSDYNSTEGFSSYTYTRSVTDATLSGGIMENITADGRQTDSPTYATSATGYHTIADKNTTKKGGEYAAVGIVPSADGTNGYVAVVAWYDASVRKVYYSYNTDPDTVSDTVWQTNAKELDTNAYTGWHVDLAVDDDGGIHIAYYNSAKGDLKYVYLSSYNATPSDPVTVDSYLSVGTNISVNVRKESGKNVPYIYYYNASSNQTPNSIKVAWRNDMATLRDGAINDKFTGAWESMTIPTTNIPVDATVCGGVPTGGTYANTVVLGYMTDTRYEKAVIKK